MGYDTKSGLTGGTRAQTRGQLPPNLPIPYNRGTGTELNLYPETELRLSRPLPEDKSLVSYKPDSDLPSSKRLGI